MPIAIDRGEFPMVVVRYRGAPTLAEFQSYLAALEELYRGGRSFGLVFDSSGGDSPPAMHRKLQADFMAKHERLIRALNMGTAFVIDSVVLRGALTAILWLQPLPCPHFICGEVEEARRWVRARLNGSPQPTLS